MKKLTIKDIIYIASTTLLVAGLVTTIVVYNVQLNAKKSQDNFQLYYDQKVAAYNVENANYSKGQIVFIGDSITDLYHLNDYYNDLPLATYNRGIGGDTTQGVINRLKVSLYDIAPSEIVLMIGINDLNGGVPSETIVNNYRTIIDGIKTNLPEAKLFTMGIAPLAISFNYGDILAKNNQIIAINSEIKALSEAKGYTHVNLYDALKRDDENALKEEYTIDGIHLSDAGFAVWTSQVKPLL